MNSKLYLICFADSRFQESINRLKNEVINFKMIEEAHYYTEMDLDPIFRKKFHPFRHSRGYGYWKWKPYLVKTMFDRINMDDILIWSDVGNVFNIQGEQRFKEYIDMVKTNETGILYFLQEGNIERWWTKGDLFNYFGVYENPQFTDSSQAWAGCFILRKTILSQEMVDRWYDVHMNHYDLTTDKRSKTPNLQGFIENRHDQSVFSLLVKSYNSIKLSNIEVYDDGRGWETLKEFPIWAARKREFKRNILQKIIQVFFRWFYREYLILFEKMDLNKEFKW